MLRHGASRAAKDFVCRKLLIIGTTASVPALAALLPDKELSHMGRYALERIPAPEAAEALREALAKTSGAEKSGIAGSLGVRRDTESVSDLSALLGDSDEQVALAAATARRHRHGRIGQGPARGRSVRRAGQAPRRRRPVDRRREALGRRRPRRRQEGLFVARRQSGQERKAGGDPRVVVGRQEVKRESTAYWVPSTQSVVPHFRFEKRL